MIRRIRAAALALACLVAPAHAQEQAPPPVETGFLHGDAAAQLADQLLPIVLQHMDRARDDRGQTLPPLSAEARAALIDREFATEIVDIGVASGVGQLCGLDWQALNFEPLMRRERSRGDRSPHQIALIALLHGAAQGVIAGGNGRCGPNGVREATAFYARKWAAPPE